jgi:hypothetical protein
MNESLAKMDEHFSAMHEDDIEGSRPSIAPNKLLQAMMLKSSTNSIMSCAQRAAASAVSGSGSGAPNIAISPSPIIWLTTPPWPLMASNISV